MLDNCDIELPTDLKINDIKPPYKPYRKATIAEQVFNERDLELDDLTFRTSDYFKQLPFYIRNSLINANFEFQFNYKQQVKRVIDVDEAVVFYIVETPDIKQRFSSFVVNEFLPNDDISLVEIAKHEYIIKYIINAQVITEVCKQNPNIDNSVNETLYVK